MSELRLSLSIAQDHPSLPGHFPGQPIVPGVVLLDEVILAAERQSAFAEFFGTSPFEIPACKFLAPVLPGAHLTLMLAHDNTGKSLTFKLLQADQLVASGSFRSGS
jgi:3-hydroxyacyl-[acyl-carrier-protein] dehydratase